MSALNNRQQEPGFTETTKRDFYHHLYGNISGCRYRHRILSFFSSEKEARGLLFFFSHRRRYYKAVCDHSLTDAGLDNLILPFLYPDKKSVDPGRLCSLHTPSEREPAGTPVQAIDPVNRY